MPTFPLATTDAVVANAVLFYAFAGTCAVSAVIVVVSRNIIRMAVALMFALISVAGLYFLLNAEFLAAVQLVVYAGGTLILVIFGVMLTNRSPLIRFDATRKEMIVGVGIAVVLLAALIAGIADWTSLHPPVSGQVSTAGPDSYAIGQLGLALLGDYLVPFELASVVLLTVMIGAAYLAKGRRESN
jgi:NADH:ubiquinone oxidoreductase subunit 6 (subunit J)